MDIEATGGNIRILERHIVSRGNGLLERLAIERKHFDDDPGDRAAILHYDPSRSRVVLARQFRPPAFLRRSHESLIEVCAGKLEGEDAESRISKGSLGRYRIFGAKSAPRLRSLHEP